MNHKHEIHFDPKTHGLTIVPTHPLDHTSDEWLCTEIADDERYALLKVLLRAEAGIKVDDQTDIDAANDDATAWLDDNGPTELDGKWYVYYDGGICEVTAWCTLDNDNLGEYDTTIEEMIEAAVWEGSDETIPILAITESKWSDGPTLQKIGPIA